GQCYNGGRACRRRQARPSRPRARRACRGTCTCAEPATHGTSCMRCCVQQATGPPSTSRCRRLVDGGKDTLRARADPAHRSSQIVWERPGVLEAVHALRSTICVLYTPIVLGRRETDSEACHRAIGSAIATLKRCWRR